jgi:hypothetical protein
LSFKIKYNEMSNVLRKALKIDITRALQGKTDDFSKKLSEIQQNAKNNRYNKGDAIELVPGVKVKFEGYQPSTDNVGFTSLDGRSKVTLTDLVEDFSVKFDVTPQGLPKIQDVNVKQRVADLEQKGYTPDQANVIATADAARVNNSALAKASDANEKVDAVVSPSAADSVNPDEVKKAISDNKTEIADEIDRASLNPTDAKNFLESNVFLGARRVAQAATGGKPVAPRLRRTTASKNLLESGTELTKRAEASATSPRVKKWFKRLGVFLGGAGILFLGAGLEDIIAACTEATIAAAADDHQQDQNGCWLIDSIALTETKVKLLTCGSFDVSTAMETCATQTYTGNNASTLTSCPDNTFNPCAKSSRSRATDQSVPLVPDVCDLYLYKDTAPAAVTGVTTKNACLDADGAALKDTQACSVYCSTENFNLPPHQTLVCRSLTYPEAYAHLLATIGIDPGEVFPPKDEEKKPPAGSTAAASGMSKPLIIAAAVLGSIALSLLVLYIVW